MGLGCSICLMGSLVLITRWTDSDQFSILAGIILAVGGIGGLLATTPLSYFSELFGWRLSFWLAAAVTFCVMVLYYFILEDRKNDLILNRSNETISLKNLRFFKAAIISLLYYLY